MDYKMVILRPSVDREDSHEAKKIIDALRAGYTIYSAEQDYEGRIVYILRQGDQDLGKTGVPPQNN